MTCLLQALSMVLLTFITTASSADRRSYTRGREVATDMPIVELRILWAQYLKLPKERVRIMCDNKQDISESVQTIDYFKQQGVNFIYMRVD